MRRVAENADGPARRVPGWNSKRHAMQGPASSSRKERVTSRPTGHVFNAPFSLERPNLRQAAPNWNWTMNEPLIIEPAQVADSCVIWLQDRKSVSRERVFVSFDEEQITNKSN